MHGFWPRVGCGYGFARRPHGGRGFGRFASDFMHGGMGGRGFFMGRKLSSEDLQLVILALLEQNPSHGYEIIRALEERSSGFYSPSPGMVYPALTYLEEVGYATVESEGSRKLYRITDTGRGYLEAHRSFVDSVLAQLAWIGKKMERARQAFSADEGRGEEQLGHAELDRARRELRALLIEIMNSDADELRRVAEILKRAAQEIRGK